MRAKSKLEVCIRSEARVYSELCSNKFCPASGVDLGEGCTGVRTPVGVGQQGCKGGAKNQYYYNRSKCPSL